MGWHKELTILVCEQVEEATGIEFDEVQSYILGNDPDHESGTWAFYHLNTIWFGFQEVRPPKVAIGSTLREAKKNRK
jgi:hypothetical protein